MKKIFFLLLSVLLFSCSSDDSKVIDFTLNVSEIVMHINESFDLEINVINTSDIHQNKLNCVSENETIAKVSNSSSKTPIIWGINEGETYLNVICDDVTKRVKVIVKPMSLERYYERYSYGFKVKDTTDLKVMHINSVLDSDDLIYLTGLRNKKLWIAKFNSQSKEQISEYLDIEEFQLNRKINLGYGNYKDIVVNKPVLCSFFENDNGWIAEIRLLDENNFESSNCYTLIFKNQTKSKIYNYTYLTLSKSKINEWFNDSYLVNIDIEDEFNLKDKWTCFNEKGETKASGKAPVYLSNKLPVSYSSFIQFETRFDYLRMLYYKLSDTEEAIFEYKHNYNTDVKSFAFTPECIGVNNDIITYRIHLTYITGEKKAHTYEFNTKELTVKEI